MAMPKKGSRLITVAGTMFRWRIRHRPTYSEGNGWTPMSFSVELAAQPGSVLKITLPCARPDNWLGERAIAVRPILVAAAIRRALDEGWTPDLRGRAFSLDITEDELPDLLGEPPNYVIPFLWGVIPLGGGMKDLPRARQIWPPQ
ncbi:hypothetical protein GCM10023194_39000 [Planotetraspora phitsanulokensis]|uniref:Uncharacterized protein n=1 Tax=Planotetraspora phitsanulokensis TaxID=575192 RepID=A0A8J3UAE6_9ACTN|nr:hypothetical protein [Planotetraspora phitsanulokensis]GII41573.1 hypothetical protein Pph01_65760 [Planotetraspora phitsanulokensis]